MASSCRRATTRAARRAISASSSTPPTVDRRPNPSTDAIFARAKAITEYRLVEAPDLDLDRLGDTRLGAMTVTVIDPVADYAELMRTLIDFDAVSRLFASGFRMRFDAMSAVTGPYATAILEGDARRAGRHGGQRGPEGGFRWPPSGSEPGPLPRPVRLDAGAGRAGFRRGVRRRRRPQHDRGPGPVRDAERQPRAARRPRPPGAGLCRGPRGRRALHAHEPRRRPGRGSPRHQGLRDPHRLEVLRQSAGCGPHHPVRRGERRHRLEPCAREGRALGGAALAQHPGGHRRARRRAGARPLADLRARTITPATTTRRWIRTPPTA